MCVNEGLCTTKKSWTSSWLSLTVGVVLMSSSIIVLLHAWTAAWTPVIWLNERLFALYLRPQIWKICVIIAQRCFSEALQVIGGAYAVRPERYHRSSPCERRKWGKFQEILKRGQETQIDKLLYALHTQYCFLEFDRTAYNLRCALLLVQNCCVSEVGRKAQRLGNFVCLANFVLRLAVNWKWILQIVHVSI